MANYKTPDFPNGPYDEGLLQRCKCSLVSAEPEQCVDRFADMTDRSKESPHVWALASHCYQQAFAPISPGTHDKENQALIITGESGVSFGTWACCLPIVF